MVEPTDRRTAGPLPGWGLAAALGLFVLALWLVLARLAPPAPRPASAPAGEFSGARAHALLAELAGDGAPRPPGSAANRAARERVIAALRRSGYEPAVQEGFACHRSGNCATVRNVVAELPGRAGGGAVLVLAHYDSVGSGAGISDDLTGVAALLEVARILKAGPPPRNPVVFLVDDGEEAGLLGAELFASGQGLRRVRAVVNLEARGTSGPSLMFETGRDNRWLMPHLARLERPFASSLFATIYDYLPNDTDFTVFKGRGLTGFNFAFVGDPVHYHTPLDNLDNSSPASLQHHGDNALAALRSLAGADLSRRRPGRAVYFDLLGWTVVWWPAALSPVLGAIALLLVLVAAVRLVRRGQAAGGGVALGLGSFLLAVAAAAALAFALAFGLRALGRMGALWPARPVPYQAAFWLVALAAVAAVAGLCRRAGFAGLWAGVWTAWSLAGLLLALTLPGASYLFVVPALVAGLAGLPLAGRGGVAGLLAAVLPAVAAALLWLPVVVMLFDGMGTAILWLIAALVAVLLSGLIPVVAAAGAPGRRWLPAAAAVAALVALGLAATGPPYTPDSPRRLNITFHQSADTGEARWLVGTPPPLPPPVRQAGRFGRPERPFPWWPPGLRAFVSPARPLPLPGPELAVLGDERTGGMRRLRLRLTSPRGAPTASLILPESAAVESIAVAGREVPRRTGRGKRTTLGVGRPGASVVGMPAEGVEIVLVLGTAEPLEVVVTDRSPGLPPQGAALARARPANAAQIQEGDGILITRKVRI